MGRTMRRRTAASRASRSSTTPRTDRSRVLGKLGPPSPDSLSRVTEDLMTTEGDRRAQGAERIPFDALVEVGGAKGQPFEAQAVNVSEEGMQLRTAYLPELGQPITCRFDA